MCFDDNGCLIVVNFIASDASVIAHGDESVCFNYSTSVIMQVIKRRTIQDSTLILQILFENLINAIKHKFRQTHTF